MPRTPISNLVVSWREPSGHEDLLLAERATGLATAVTLVGRLGAVGPAASDGADVTGRPDASDRFDGADGFAAGDLPVGDIDVLIADLRRARLGDRLVAEGDCTRCGAPVDVDFSLAAYCDHRRPRLSASAVRTEEHGWWLLRRTETRFRIPSARDVLAAAESADARAFLLDRCVRGDRSGTALRSTERAMETLAPTLRSEVTGACPECGNDVVLDADVRELCLAELGFLSGAVLDEVHLLASAYHWPEQVILDLPSRRRTSYAERVRRAYSTVTSLEALNA